MIIGYRGSLATSLIISMREEDMSYRSYRAGVERRRATLQAELSQANDLRRASHLPQWEIQAEIAHQCPLLDQEAWTAQRRGQAAFARFRRQQLATIVMPTVPVEADWEKVRVLGLRKAFLEHQIEQAWLTKTDAEASTVFPRHA